MDYYKISTGLSFEIGASHIDMMARMNKASSIDLLDCYGPTNRLITIVSKIRHPTTEDLEELDHYYAKRNCLYLELQKRLKTFDFDQAQRSYAASRDVQEMAFVNEEQPT